MTPTPHPGLPPARFDHGHPPDTAPVVPPPAPGADKEEPAFHDEPDIPSDGEDDEAMTQI